MKKLLFVLYFFVSVSAVAQSALSFRGKESGDPVANQDYVTIADNNTLDLNNTFTIEAWVYPTDNINNTIIDKGNYQYLFQTHANGNTGLGFYRLSTGWFYSSGTVPINTWSHVAVTFDLPNNQVKFYLNGGLLSTHTGLSNTTADNLEINIGRQQPSSCQCNRFDGTMDELRIWNTVRTQAEIAANRNFEQPNGAPGLLALYHFNQSSGTTLIDDSGKGNNGTLTNFAFSGNSNWVSPGAVTNGVVLQSTLDNVGLTSATPAAGVYSLRLVSSGYTGPLARVRIGTVFYDVYPDATTKKFALTSKISAFYTTFNATLTGATTNALSSVLGSNSASVAIWYDQSGNANDGKQATDANQPRIVNSGTIELTNGNPTINFLGSASLIVSSTAFNADLSGSIVYSANSSSNSSGGAGTWYNMNGLFGSEQAGGTTDFGIGVYNGRFTVGNGPSDNSTATLTSVNDGVARVSSWSRTNSTGGIAIFTNGFVETSSTLNSGNRSAVTSVAIGANSPVTGIVYFRGTISEMVLMPSVVSSPARKTIEGNQGTFYGITITGQPVITAQPSTSQQTVCSGCSFSALSVSATGTGLSYQWYSNTVNSNSGGTLISGATTSSYTPSSATAGTTYYYVVVSSTSGFSTTSAVSGVMLTVSTLTNVGLSGTTLPAGAYSLRLLSSAYTGPLVRVTISGSYYDVYPDATTKKFALTSAISASYPSFNATPTGATANALSSVLGSNSASVAIWYDQSGYARDVSQATTAQQPSIAYAGVINLKNNAPTVYFNSQKLSSANFSNAYNSAFSLALVAGVNNDFASNTFVTKTSSNLPSPFDFYNTNMLYGASGSFNSWFFTQGFNSANGFSQWTFTANNAGAKAFRNGVANNTTSTATSINDGLSTPLIFGSRADGVTALDGWISEVLAFNSVLSSGNQSIVETSQIAAYSPPPTIASFSPTSGAVGTSITINGSAFNATPSNNVVFFGAARAVAKAGSTTTQLLVDVPAGATSATPLVVRDLVTGLSVSSVTAISGTNARMFTVTTSPSFTLSPGRFSKTDITVSGVSTPETADFNNDGNTDLIFANSTQVFISLGNGSGGFGASTLCASSSVLVSLGGTGDFNQDGKMDFIVLNTGNNSEYSQTLTVFLGNGTGTFSSGGSFNTGVGPADCAITDFNGDGKLDLVVANRGFDNNPAPIGTTISVLLGNGDGTFGAQSVSSAGSAPIRVVAADFNNDGKADVAVSNLYNSSLSVFLGTGSGTFTGPTTVSAGNWPIEIVVGNFNNDANNNLDLVVQNFYNDNLVFFPGNGDGTFGTSTTVYSNTGKVHSATVGNFNGDANLDVAFAQGADNAVGIITGNGNGTFNTVVSRPVLGATYAIISSDFDEDGKADIASFTGTDNLSLLLNNLVPAPVVSSFSPISGPVGTTVTITGTNFTNATAVSFGGTAAASFTVNSATSITAVVGAGATGSISVTNPDGTGSKTGFTLFQLPPPTIAAGGGTTVCAPSAVSLSAATASFTDLSYLSFTTGTIGSTQWQTFVPVAAGVTTAIKIRTNGCQTINSTLNIYSGTGNSGPLLFSTPFSYSGCNVVYSINIPASNNLILTPGSTYTFETVGDDFQLLASSAVPGSYFSTAYGLNPGWKLNYETVITPFAGTYQWYRNGTLISGATAATYSATTTGSYTCLNINGAYSSAASNAISVTVNNCPPSITTFSPSSGTVGTSVTITGTSFNTTLGNNIVFFGATKATVTAATATSLTVTVPSGATYAPITVLNTTSSLLTTSSKSFTPTFSPSKGTFGVGDFSAKVDITAAQGLYSIAVGDLDGDGKADLAVANNDFGLVSVYRNTTTLTNITFAAKIDIATGSNARSASMGDIDGDGKLDLVVVNSSSNTISVLRNTSTSGISFAPKVDISGTGATPFSAAIGDIDGDGKADLAVANFGTTTVSVFRNTGSVGVIGFSSAFDFPVGTNPVVLSMGDIDGDGKLDVATPNFGSASVSVLRNISTVGTVNFATKVDATVGTQPWSVSIGDLDGDGKADLASGNYGGNSISVLRNTAGVGSIGFAVVSLTSNTQPRGVAIGDIDGDGKADLAAATNGTLSLFHNSGSSGTINFDPRVDLTVNVNLLSTALGDLDNDGQPDLIAASYTGLTLTTIRNNPVFAPTITLFSPTSAAPGTPVTITGTNFTGATAVSFGGVAAAKFTVVNSTTISAVVGAGGMGSVSVTTAVGTGTLAGFTYAPLTPPGNAIDFDGTNDAVSIPDNASLDFSTQYTFESWIYLKAYQYGTLVSKFEDDGNNRGWMINFGETGDNTKLCVVHDDTGNWTNPIQWNSGFSPALNTWYHIAVTFDASLPSNEIKLYVNGALFNQTNWAFSITPKAANVYLGGYDGPGNGLNAGANDRFFNGRMDETRLWNVARTQAQIDANKNQVLASGPVAYYNFDHGTGGGTNTGITTLVDNAATNHGTLANFALSGTASNYVESYALVVPTSIAATAINSSGFTANWSAPTIGTVNNYVLDVSTSATFGSFIPGYNALSVAGTSQGVTGLSAATTYYYRARANKTSVAGQGGYSATQTVNTSTIAPSIGSFSNVTKTFFNGSYTITAPSSNSAGSFSYTSSNTGVATVSGIDVTIMGAGTTTITANQAASGPYSAGSTSATLTVVSVTVVTKNGKITTTDSNFVNSNGAINTNTGVDRNGKPLVTKQ